MENCKSFTLNIKKEFNFTGTNVATWNPTSNQFPWLIIDGSALRKSDFNLEGFKNIEVYGFSLVGMVYPNKTAVNNPGIVQDWGVFLTIDGTTNLINGFFDTNTFSATQGGKEILLSKDLNTYNLADPIVSVKKISISGLTANGIQSRSTSAVELFFDLSIIVYYKFEGE